MQPLSNECAPAVPAGLSDSSITSLAGLVRDLSPDEARTGIQEQPAYCTRPAPRGRFNTCFVVPCGRLALRCSIVRFAPARFLAGSCAPQHAMRLQPGNHLSFSVPSRTVTHLPCARISRSHAICRLVHDKDVLERRLKAVLRIWRIRE